jgi:hypothetical protein
VADSVRGRDEQRTTIGTRAASKLLVEVRPAPENTPSTPQRVGD